MAQSVTRALQAIKRYNPLPEQIDQTILAAINVTLCLASHGDDRVRKASITTSPSAAGCSASASGKGWPT